MIAMAVVAFICGFIVNIAHSHTVHAIETHEYIQRSSIIRQLFHSNGKISESQGSYPAPTHYWTITEDSTVTGYAFEVESEGYSGPINFIAGVDTAGIITGMSILSESETPGRGGRIEERRPGVSSGRNFFVPVSSVKPWFCAQFEGISIKKPVILMKHGEWNSMDESARKKLADSNSVSAVSGATFSSQAVVEGITHAVTAYFEAVRGAK
jgi:RnfABCDGE-type electron transport complex G subunit